MTLSAAAVFLCLNKYKPVQGLTLSPHADDAAGTARTILTMIMVMTGLAAIVNFAVLMATHRENRERQLKEEKRESDQKRRSWLEKFLDPQFLNTPSHIKMREAYFQKLINKSRTYCAGLLLPAIALVVMLLVRLFLGAPAFLGDPHSLDFGWKYGVDTGDEAEKSISYTPEVTSYVHSIQGVFSALLSTPILMRGLLLLTRGRLRSLLLFAPYGLSVYPTYNLIKRFIKAREAFAGSSFSNNGFEWASGFMLGLAIGQLITAFGSTFAFQRTQTAAIADEENLESDVVEGESDVDSEENLRATGVFQFLQYLFGFMLVFTVYAAAVLFGLTWNSCEDDTTCVNAEYAGEDADSISTKILIVMLAVPSSIMVGGSFFF